MAHVIVGISEIGSDELRLDELARQLRQELLQTDIESVEPLQVGEAPEGTRSASMMAAGALIATVGPLGLGGFVSLIGEWMKIAGDRAERSVRLEIDGDVLELGGINKRTQQKFIDEWMARHSNDPAPA